MGPSAGWSHMSRFIDQLLLCFKSPEFHLEEVSTTCGSGWVNDQHAILLLILGAKVYPPATAGGTDCVQL